MSDPWLPAIDGVSLAAVAIGPAEHPHAPELDRLGPRAVVARRVTFVAGRRAARRALERRFGSLPQSLRIDPADDGRPLVSTGLPRTTHLSISHAGGWAVAAVADAPLGIDLVELEATSVGFAREVFAPGELEGAQRALSSLTDPRMPACLAFAAKEAALKWLGVGMRVPLMSVRVSYEDAPCGSWPWHLPVQIEHGDGRAALTLSLWPFAGPLYCALLVR